MMLNSYYEELARCTSNDVTEISSVSSINSWFGPSHVSKRRWGAPGLPCADVEYFLNFVIHIKEQLVHSHGDLYC